MKLMYYLYLFGDAISCVCFATIFLGQRRTIELALVWWSIVLSLAPWNANSSMGQAGQTS